ncbi:hypothetical protein [Cohnella thailandensis]|uniref:YtkA-like domain-containing protein n=1 Tax=Cohnella thailandensis TaxID=557557 RepID=A0A841T0K7_9BACL|nr:hypothetical protein [Cohnella thailandensis]MBB6637072.1 hypothetical protein [Cohnella thailandensis]MBP1973040.1 hypothetical protein [Cohnella thailandensis]
MKRKAMIMLTGVVAFGVLSACGNSKESAHSDSHGGMNHEAKSSVSANESAGDYQAAFSFASGAVMANEQSNIHIQITDATGNAVNDFELNHEKLLHLIVISKDLSYFSHIHPEYQGEGKFSIGTTFPSGGEYKVFADFVPKGGSSTILSDWVNVEGEPHAAETIKADSNLTKVVDGIEIELTMSSAKVNEEVTLSFNILDAQTKEGIRNLEQYLGAVGHVVILSEDAEQYLHVHPMDATATGPKAEFMTSFPKSGIYKIWGQFQHGGKVFTVPFVVEVN